MYIKQFKQFQWLFWVAAASIAVSCAKSSAPEEENPVPPAPVLRSFDLGRVDSLNKVCNYASSVVSGEDGSMKILLLRDDESIDITPEDLKSGLKVEDKGRYFLFSRPGGGEPDAILGSDIPMPYNPPLRRMEEGRTLNILCIGNSLTADAVEHLPRILKDMGIGNVNIDVIYHGGWSLLNHWNNFRDTKCSRYIYEAGKDDWTEFDPNLLDDCAADVLALREYDIVTLQDDTRTNCSGWSEEGRAAFLELVDHIQHAQPTHRPSIVYFAPHCPAAKLYGTHNTILWELFDGDQDKCYAAFLAQMREATSRTPVDLFFSNATAVQNLRTSELNENHPLDLSRDGTHSDYGVTRFCESALFFQSILKPALGADISESRYLFGKSDETPGKCSTPVDDRTRPIAVEAALNALKTPFEITRMSEEKPPVEGSVNYVLKLCDYPITLENAPEDICTIKKAGAPLGLDWEISGEAHDKFVITNGAANGRYKIGANADYVDPFILKTNGLAGKKISKVSVWMSSGVKDKLSRVSVSVGDREYLPLTEAAVSVTAVKNTGFEYSADCGASTEGEVKITIRSTAAFYIYKIYIDYEQE